MRESSRIRRKSKKVTAMAMMALFVLAWGGPQAFGRETGEVPDYKEEVEEFEKMFTSEYQEEDYYRTDRLLISATGSLKPVRKAPSLATVITAEDIEKMGATSLDEALETVPGLHVEPSGLNRFTSIYSLRGIHASANPHVLMLINGVPWREIYGGNRLPTFRMSVHHISRIEVIRGPGSALHGADAFAGVINVVTKDGEEIDGFNLGARYGSFSSSATWLQYGGLLKGWDTAVSVELMKSSGDDSRIIDRDSAGNQGVMETHFNNVDSYIRFRRTNWLAEIFGSWQNDNAMGPATQTLVPGCEQDNLGVMGALTYTNSDWFKDWEVSGRLSRLYLHTDSLWFLSPTLVLNPFDVTKANSFDLSTVYKGFKRHVWRLGGGMSRIYFETDANQNVVFTGAGPVFFPFQNIKGTNYMYCYDQSRKVWYVLAQDEWSFHRRWELVLGVRYDKFSDFGSTTNPRAALVWETRPDLTTKLLYGQAFRSPTFSEQYGRANPVAWGSPDIGPEEIETMELVFDYLPTADLRTVLSLFTYEVEGLIDYVGGAGVYKTAANYQDQEGYGFELEADWQARDDLVLKANFARQRAKDKLAKILVADAPGMQFYANGHWTFRPDWSLDVSYNWVGDRKRGNSDNRPEIEDYDLVGMTLRRKNIRDHWDVALAVRNLFDKDARVPSDGQVINDYPGEGRSVWAEVRYFF